MRALVSKELVVADVEGAVQTRFLVEWIKALGQIDREIIIVICLANDFVGLNAFAEDFDAPVMLKNFNDMKFDAVKAPY